MKELPLQFDDSITFGNVGEWEHLAYQLANHEKWDQAANSLQKAADADPGQLQRWLTIATWRQRCGQITQAIAALSNALQLPYEEKIKRGTFKSTFRRQARWSVQDELELWSELAHLLAQDSRWQECEDACMEVLERQSDNFQITELMALACLQTEHLDAAEHLLLSLLRRVPLEPWYRLRYATLLQTQGRLGAAQQEFLRLLTMKLPKPFLEEVGNSIEYLDQMQFQQVIILLENNVELRKALARDPHNQLEMLGFHLTEAALESLQNALWEHFDQAPFDTLETSPNVTRLH